MATAQTVLPSAIKSTTRSPRQQELRRSNSEDGLICPPDNVVSSRSHPRRRQSDLMLRQHGQRNVHRPRGEVERSKTKLSTTGSTLKPRPVFRRSKITDPAVVACTNSSFLSLETSSTFVPEGANAEDSWSSANDNDDLLINSKSTVVVERHVRFRVDDHNAILVDYVPTNNNISGSGRWFQSIGKDAESGTTGTTTVSGIEFRHTINDAKAYIATIKTECPEIVEYLTNTFHNKGLAAGLLSENDTGVLQIWSASHGRGLEDNLIDDVKKHRIKARSRVLKFQEKMSSIGCRDYAQALRERSCMESKQSAAFARILAIGDALEAETIHFGKSSSRKFLKK